MRVNDARMVSSVRQTCTLVHTLIWRHSGFTSSYFHL